MQQHCFALFSFTLEQIVLTIFINVAYDFKAVLFFNTSAGNRVHLLESYDGLSEKMNARLVAGKMYQTSKRPQTTEALKSIILRPGTDKDTAETLLNMLLEQSNDIGLYSCFLEALKKCDQQYIAECLTHNGITIYNYNISCVNLHVHYMKRGGLIECRVGQPMYHRSLSPCP